MTKNKRRVLLALAATAILLVPLLAACSIGSSPSPTPPPRTPTAAAGPGGGTPAIPLPSGVDVKIDSTLLDVAAAFQQGGRPAAEEKARETGLLDKNNNLRITLILSDNNSQPIVDKVKSIGGRVGSVSDGMVDVIMPLDVLITYVGANGNNAVRELAAFSSVREVQVTRMADLEGLTFPPGATAAEIRSAVAGMVVEGVGVTGADKWHAAGITGKGVKIGILDGGFEGYETLLGRGLPQRVGFRSFTADGGVGESAHGTAVAEIVHAMAPEAELILVPFDTQADFARALRYLVDEAKVQILQMSFGWQDSRGDGTGTTQELVNYARDKGVLPVKSAGNEGDSHYTAPFNPDPNGRHQFAPGVTRLEVQGVDGEFQVRLRWDAWSGAPVNYDLYLVDEGGTRVASSRNVQGPNKSPFEAIYYNRGRAGTKYYVVIEAVGQQPSTRLDLFGKDTDLDPNVPGRTPATSLSAPGDADGAFTVGAINVRDDKLEAYSSQGPTLDGRRKPDISGLARVTTTSTQGRPFFGTSAACPHVSGAAALVLSAQPGATAAQVRAFLEKNAKDLEESGPDPKTGFGRLALGPAESARTPVQPSAPASASSAPISDPFTDPASGLPNGGEGRYDGGRYTLTPSAANRAAWSVYSPTYGNATVEATVQLVGGSGTAGLVFWQSGAEDYYLFSITADGFYQIARYGRGGWASLVPWTKAEGVAANGPNRLRLETAGARITPSINGQALPPATAPAAGNGRVGLLAAAFAQPGASASFSDFRVTPAP